MGNAFLQGTAILWVAKHVDIARAGAEGLEIHLQSAIATLNLKLFAISVAPVGCRGFRV